jgi:hypothetical protein
MSNRTQRPTFLQAIVVAGAGLLIALFGCLGAIAGFGNGSNSALGEAGAIGFGLGVLVFAVGGVLLIVVVVRALFARPAPDDGAAPPAE